MKRILMLLPVFSFLALILSDHADARKKRSEPVISKRGKLIFEDDFSGKELLWTFDAGQCEWQIAKKSLVAKKFKDGVVGAKIAVHRSFPPLKDVILELKLFVSENCDTTVSIVRPPSFPTPRIKAGSFCLSTYRQGAGLEDLAVSPFPYRKPRWITVLYENLGPRYALTVDGKTITRDFPVTDGRRIEGLTVTPNSASAGSFAIDDVKVWEALPKDEEDEKGKKKRKRK